MNCIDFFVNLCAVFFIVLVGFKWCLHGDGIRLSLFCVEGRCLEYLLLMKCVGKIYN